MPRKRFDLNPIPQPAAPARDQALTASPDGSRELYQARLVPLTRLISDPDQPRKSFPPESLQELADSLRAQGMRQPITAYYDDSRERFVVISGERRLRAAMMAGLHELPVLVEHRPGSDADRLVLQLAENLVREDLTDLEAATALGRLKELRPKDWLAVAAQHGFGRRRSYQFLSLLEDAQPLREALERGAVREGHVAELRRAPEQSQARLLHEVETHSLSVADTRRLVAGERERAASPTAPSAPKQRLPPNETATSPAETSNSTTAHTRDAHLTAGDVVMTITSDEKIENKGSHSLGEEVGGDGREEAAPISVGAILVGEKTRRERSRRLRQRLERISMELRNVHLEEVTAEYTYLPEIIVHARKAKESLESFIQLLERIQLENAGAMEQPES